MARAFPRSSLPVFTVWNFLNTLLEGERAITDLSFLDKEQQALFDGDRSPIYDILCESSEKHL